MSFFPTNQDLDPARLRKAFGVFPSGVVALGAVVDGQQIGLAASSFRSESLDPPLVSVSVATSSTTWPILRQASHIGITVLAEHHGLAARQLAGPAESRFDGLEQHTTEDGAIVLTDGVAQYNTTIYREVEAGDHVIVLLEIKSVEHPEAGEPLLFHRSGFGRVAAV